MLFCRDAEVRVATALGERLRAERDRFLSRRAVQSFGGYATAQLKRIRTHRRWLLAPPTGAPSRADFDLPEVGLLPRDQLAAAQAAVDKQLARWELDLAALTAAEARHVRDQVAELLVEVGVASDEDRLRAAGRAVGLDDNLIEVMKRERAYRSARQQWRQFQRWQRERNPARAALEAAHGFDTKHGAHLVRLLRMALEIVTTGRVHVWRGDRDADELQAIRAGAWSYERLDAWAADAQARLREADASHLPARPDLDALDALGVELMLGVLG